MLIYKEIFIVNLASPVSSNSLNKLNKLVLRLPHQDCSVTSGGLVGTLDVA